YQVSTTGKLMRKVKSLRTKRPYAHTTGFTHCPSLCTLYKCKKSDWGIKQLEYKLILLILVPQSPGD
uniref:Uncharacterized protein n=1 Tax=Amphimedon queenslandica TaxID=400682 RepID=A0A1X7T384_AMPQE